LGGGVGVVGGWLDGPFPAPPAPGVVGVGVGFTATTTSLGDGSTLDAGLGVASTLAAGV
jgi:hypothetical protein